MNHMLSFCCPYDIFPYSIQVFNSPHGRLISDAVRSAKGGKGLLADHLEEALYKKSAKGLPKAT